MKKVIDELIKKYGNDFKGATDDKENHYIILNHKTVVLSKAEIKNKSTDEILTLIDEK